LAAYAVRNVLIALPGLRSGGRRVEAVVQIAVTDVYGDCGCSCTCSSTDGSCTCTCTCTCTQTKSGEIDPIWDPEEAEMGRLKDALRTAIEQLGAPSAGGV
jgi:hypothetical protein